MTELLILILQLVIIGILLYPKLAKKSTAVPAVDKWAFFIPPKETVAQKLVKRWLRNIQKDV